MRDDIVEPVRGALITGFHAVKAAALHHGALACSISGAGPALFALADGQAAAQAAADGMSAAWASIGVDATAHVARPLEGGADLVDDSDAS